MWCFAVLIDGAFAAGVERAGVRLDLGLGASTEGAAARAGIAPEVWVQGVGLGLRASFDGNLEMPLLGAEIDLLRLEPYAFVPLSEHWIAGAGVGIARATRYPGFSLGGGEPEETRVVATGSLIGGWTNEARWFAVLLRLDGATWPTGAATLAVSVAPGKSW